MSSLYAHDNYQTTLESFTEQVTNGDCLYTAWGLFKTVHTDITKGKCPICECLLDNSVQRLTSSGNTFSIKATIDHYRPQEYYPFLKCEHTNYLLMCSDCNSMYKKSEFPLYLKALATIKLFGLGDCEENRHENENVHNCRIELLEKYYDKFYPLAKARKIGKDEFLEVLSEHPENHHFGFTKFIAREQFKIIE